MSGRFHVLVVGNDADERALAALVLRARLTDWHIDEVGSPIQLGETLARQEIHAVVVAAPAAFRDELELVSAVKRARPACAVVVMAPPGSETAIAHAIVRGIDAYVERSAAGLVRLAAAVTQAIARSSRLEIGGQSSQRLARAVAGLGATVVIVDAAGTMVDALPGAGVQLGWGDVEVRGRRAADLLADAADRERFATLLARGAAFDGFEARCASGSAADAWLRITGRPLREPAGAGFELVAQDITQFKRAEAALAHRATALTAANTDLQQFASAISHDLHEPLHVVARYSEMIRDRCGERLDDDGRHYLQHVLDGTQRLQRMIDDALEYARVATRGRPFAPVDFESVVDEARERLKTAIEESRAQITTHGLPTLPADGPQMVQLFQNLLGNAVKFCGEADPVVQISATEGPQEWVFAVVDNGIGIAAEQHDRIFGMFQRLHTAEEIPGTGVGLALCKRIVERHGGRIWVTSRPDEGATFYFSLPKAASGGERSGSDA